MQTKYTEEKNILCGILGSEKGLNDHRRRITHEGNSTITRGDAIRGLDLHRQPKHKERDDRQEIRTAREQVEVFSEIN